MLPGYSDQTMWGPQGDPNQERRRLKPGDRMADGTVFQGSDPEAVLLAQLDLLERQMRPLQEQANDLLSKLHQLHPEKYGPLYLGQIEQTAPETSLSNLPEPPPWDFSAIAEKLSEAEFQEALAPYAEPESVLPFTDLPAELVTPPAPVAPPKPKPKRKRKKPAAGANRAQG